MASYEHKAKSGQAFEVLDRFFSATKNAIFSTSKGFVLFQTLHF